MLETNFEESKKYFELMNKAGVTHVELRILKNLNKKSDNKYFPTSEEGYHQAREWIQTNNYHKGTVNATFNIINSEVIKKGKYLRDTDISQIRFLMIDIDPEKAEKKQSASEEEKNFAMKKAEEVALFLQENELPYQVKIDTGNGVHLFLLVEKGDVQEVQQLHKSLLTILGEKFNNQQVKIDSTVSNPARIGKLVGSPAVKGEHTTERPHRVSTFLDIQQELTQVSIEKLRTFVKKYALSNSTKAIKKKSEKGREKDYVLADAKKWLDFYNLSYTIKENEYGQLFIFDACPLKEHSQNQSGASLSYTLKGRCKFGCLHDSHNEFNIYDFIEKYPIPDEAQINTMDQGVTFEKIGKKGLNQGKRYQVGDFILSKEGIYKYKEDWVKISDAMFISDVWVEKETQFIRMKLNYLLNKLWSSIEIGGDELQYGIFKRLSKYGITFASREEYQIIDFLNEQKKQVTYQYEHHTIGWVKEEQMVYQAGKSYGESNDQEISFLSNQSIYKLHPHGSVEVFNELIQEEVLGTNMELALCVGVSPVLLGYLKVSGEREVSNVLVNLMGQSSTGKTTAIVLMASLYGDVETIVRNWNATQNSIIKLATNNYGGVPLILDELGASSIQNLSSLLYQFSMGEEKLRMKGSEFIKPKKFHVMTVMTAEESLSNYTDVHLDGLKVRQLEFQDISWTKSGKSSEKIKQLLYKNNGYFIPTMIERLYERNLSIIVEKFDCAKEILLDKMKDSPYKNRISNNLALILASAMLIQELFNWSLDTEMIERELVRAYDQLTNIDSQEGVLTPYEIITELIVRNAKRFSINGVVPKVNLGLWGNVKITDDSVVVHIFANKFQKIVEKELNIKNPKRMIRALIDDGKINSEKGRQTKRIHLKKNIITVYEILLPKELSLYFTGVSNVTEETKENDIKTKGRRIIDTQTNTKKDFEF